MSQGGQFQKSAHVVSTGNYETQVTIQRGEFLQNGQQLIKRPSGATQVEPFDSLYSDGIV